jgi:DNA mismatch repair protein MutS
LPKATLQQARRRLAELEQRGGETQASQMAPAGAGCATAIRPLRANAIGSAGKRWRRSIPDELTPKQALEALYS